MKIGFLDRLQANWTAGASYTRSVVQALASAPRDGCELFVVSGRSSSFAELPPGVGEIRLDRDTVSSIDLRTAVEQHGIDVLLPVKEILQPNTPCALVGWIPDFQHNRLPEYFSAEALRQRDRYFAYLVDNCDAMMFSSEAVLADFRELYPAFAGPSASVHFPSGFAYEPEIIQADPRPVIEKYGLPPAFVLVANQFWKHKNHLLVVEAVARARREQPGVHVVMVGVPSDTRDPANAHLSELFRRLSVERLGANLSVLGEVPFADLVALMRCAQEVIQPSRFEGWNTTVQDAIALGKRVACSDLPVHREQVPAAFFFSPDDPDALAGHLASLDWSQCGWTDRDTEAASLRAERERGREWAEGLLDLCRQAVAARQAASGQRVGWGTADPEEELRRNPLVYLDHLKLKNTQLEERVSASAESVRRLSEERTALQTSIKELREVTIKALREEAKSLREEKHQIAQELYRERTKRFRERLSEEFGKLRARLGAGSGNPGR